MTTFSPNALPLSSFEELAAWMEHHPDEPLSEQEIAFATSEDCGKPYLRQCLDAAREMVTSVVTETVRKAEASSIPASLHIAAKKLAYHIYAETGRGHLYDPEIQALILPWGTHGYASSQARHVAANTSAKALSGQVADPRM